MRARPRTVHQLRSGGHYTDDGTLEYSRARPVLPTPADAQNRVFHHGQPLHCATQFVWFLSKLHN